MSCYPNNSCNRNVLKSCSNTDVVVYTGENLTCTGIEYGDSVTVVLQKLDEKYCEILNIIENCSTTTTSTTTISPIFPCVNPFSSLLTPWVPTPTTTTTTTIPPTTTTTTTLPPPCCAPTIQSVSQDINGLINVTYTYNSDPSACLACQEITLQRSDGFPPWFTASTSSCGSQIGTSVAVPAGTYLRLIMGCGSTQSGPSNVVQVPTTTTTTTTPPIPNLIRLTPEYNDPSSIGILAERISGVNPDYLTFSMQLDIYTGSNCTGGSNSYSYNPYLPDGEASRFTSATSTTVGYLSAKIVSLTINGNTITTSPQTITVNGTDYVIEGFNTCTVL